MADEKPSIVLNSSMTPQTLSLAEKRICPFPTRPRTDQDWEAWRPQIEHYYHDQDCELNELMAKMEELGLCGTRKQYMNRLKQWGMLKNIKAQEYEVIVQIRARRQALGKQTIFMVRKRIVSNAKIDRYVRRSRNRKKELIQPESAPPDVEFRTPPISRAPTPDPAQLSSTGLPGATSLLETQREDVSQSDTSQIHDLEQSTHASAFTIPPSNHKTSDDSAVVPYFPSVTGRPCENAVPSRSPDVGEFNKHGSPECCRHIGDSTVVPERVDDFFTLLFRALSLLATDEYSVEALSMVDACLAWQFRSKHYAIFRIGMMCMMQAYLQFHGSRGSARMLAMIAGFTRQLTAMTLGENARHPVVRTLAMMRESLSSGSVYFWRWGLGSLTYRIGYLNTDSVLSAEMRQSRLAVLEGAAASLKGISGSDAQPPKAVVPAYLDIAAAMISLKRFDLADALIAAIQIPKNVPEDFHAQSWCVLAHISEHRGRYGEAVEMLGRVTEGADPTLLAQLLRHQASLLGRMGKFAKAGHLMKEADSVALMIEHDVRIRAGQDVA